MVEVGGKRLRLLDDEKIKKRGSTAVKMVRKRNIMRQLLMDSSRIKEGFC